MNDPERDLHVAELKVRLKPADRELLLALARKKDIPPAVLARSLLLRELERVTLPRIPIGRAERRGA